MLVVGGPFHSVNGQSLSRSEAFILCHVSTHRQVGFYAGYPRVIQKDIHRNGDIFLKLANLLLTEVVLICEQLVGKQLFFIEKSANLSVGVLGRV